MNTQEFAEWLRKEALYWDNLADEWIASAESDYQVGYAKGSAESMRSALSRLTTLDSSHDLPSTKG